MSRPDGAGRVMVLIPLVYFVFVAGEFMAATELTLRLTRAGHSALAVGAVASALWFGLLGGSVLSHRVVARWGTPAAFVAGCALAALATAALALQTLYAGQLLGAWVLGLSGGVVWVAGEAWLAEAAPAERRGVYVGLFETSVGAGMVAGPVILSALREAQASPWPVSVGLMVLSCAIAWPLLRLAAPAHGAVPGPAAVSDAAAAEASDWRRIALPLIGVAVLSGVLEGGCAALLPAVALRGGFTDSAAALLGAVIGAGSALLQAPFGWAADRIGLRRSLLGAWAALIVAAAALWLFAGRPDTALWPVAFVLGGAGGAGYTLVVIELGHRLRGAALVRAMAWLVTAYTAGSSLGPVAGGALFDAGGLAALAAGLLLLSLAGWVGTARVLPAQRAALAGRRAT